MYEGEDTRAGTGSSLHAALARAPLASSRRTSRASATHLSHRTGLRPPHEANSTTSALKPNTLREFRPKVEIFPRWNPLITTSARFRPAKLEIPYL